MGVSRLQGTPWHPEQFHRKEGDDRRYKGRCKFFYEETERCSYRVGKCIGSAHCPYYAPMSEGEFKEKQSQRRKKRSKRKIGEDDCFYY